MHSPDISDPDGEWIELYNSGNEAVNLSDWTLDGSDFDDITIEPDEYVIIARELLDGDDEDTDSFESYWGNNNGIWDEPYQGADGSFSLTPEDTIILSGDYTEEISYNESFGGDGGNSIQRLSLTEWEEAPATPGNGSFTTTEPSDGEVEIHLTVANSPPNITGITFLTDDSLDEGVQVLPNIDLPKEVNLNLDYGDNEGDVDQIFLEVNNNTYNFTSSNLSFEMQTFDLAQEYTVNITICDNNYCDSELTSFEYLGIISTIINTSSLDFELNVNEQQETNLQITNTGNVVVDLEVGGTDLVSNSYNISIENLEVFSDIWLPLNTNPLLDLDVLPNTDEELLFKITIPREATPGDYNGIITVTSMEST